MTEKQKLGVKVDAKRQNGHGFQAILELLLEHMTDGVMITDARGHRAFQNRALTEIVGPDTSPADEPPKWLLESEHERYLQYLDRYASQHDLAAETLSLEWVLADATGVTRPVVFRIVPVRDAGGGLTALLWIVIDSSEHNSDSRVERAVRNLIAEIGRDRPTDAAGHVRLELQKRNELSRRECEVLELLLEGLRVHSIADELGISPHTVRNHLKSMFHKTGAHSQADLIAIIRNQGQLAGSDG